MKDSKFNIVLVPPYALRGISAVRVYGAAKHGEKSWKDCNPNVFLSAAYRHLENYRRGVELDKDSGLPHLDHALTNLALLAELKVKPKEWDSWNMPNVSNPLVTDDICSVCGKVNSICGIDYTCGYSNDEL